MGSHFIYVPYTLCRIKTKCDICNSSYAKHTTIISIWLFAGLKASAISVLAAMLSTRPQSYLFGCLITFMTSNLMHFELGWIKAHICFFVSEFIFLDSKLSYIKILSGTALPVFGSTLDIATQ